MRKPASTLKSAASTSKDQAEVCVWTQAMQSHTPTQSQPSPRLQANSKGTPRGDDHPDGAIEYAAPALYRTQPPPASPRIRRTPGKNCRNLSWAGMAGEQLSGAREARAAPGFTCPVPRSPLPIRGSRSSTYICRNAQLAPCVCFRYWAGGRSGHSSPSRLAEPRVSRLVMQRLGVLNWSVGAPSLVTGLWIEVRGLSPHRLLCRAGCNSHSSCLAAPSLFLLPDGGSGSLPLVACTNLASAARGGTPLFRILISSLHSHMGFSA